MLTKALRMAALHAFLQADPAAGGGGNNNGNENPPATPPADPESKPLGEAGEKALKAERDARKAAERKAADIEKELSDLKTAAQKREDDEAAEQGKWRELAEKRDADLTATATERDTLKTRLEVLEGLAADRLKALLADIPKEIAELGPDAETPIEKRLAWAEKAAKAAAARTPGSGNGPNPPPASGRRSRDELIQTARASGRYRA